MATESTIRRACGTDHVHHRLLREVRGYAEARSGCENHAWRAARSSGIGRAGCTTIPVVVHVVHKTTAENISDAQIHSQISVLNEDYRKKNGDVSTVPASFAPLATDARIEFELATVDPDGNPTDGIVRRKTTKASFGDNDEVKFQASGGSDAWPADQYLNIWVCNLQPWLGYAQFPGGPANTDGVVILHTAFGTSGTAQAPFNLGRTATHEVGHWLNLRHIWGDDGGGCSGSDFVADTPNQAGPNYGTPSGTIITCNNGPNGDMYMNYMDYVDDAVMVMFSAGQVTRMQATLDGLRSSVGTTRPCVSVQPTLKFRDDHPTLKFLDDPQPTLKWLDEHGTLKFIDDPQPTLKFRDDQPTVKFTDDPQPTLKFVDDPQPTLKFSDDPGTLKFSDDPGSLKFIDDPQPTLKFSDDGGTSPAIDPVKQPGLDKAPGMDLPFPLGPLGGMTEAVNRPAPFI